MARENRHRFRTPAPKLTNKQRFGLYGKVLKEAKPIWGWILVSCLICCVIIVCATIGPKLTGEATDAIYAYWQEGRTGLGLLEPLIPTLLILLGVYSLGAIMRWLNMYLMNNVVSHHYTCAIRIRMSDKVRRLPIKFIDGTPVGQILENMTDDVSAMGNSVHQVVNTLMQGVLQMLFISVVMLLEDWRLGLIVLATTPISVLMSVYLSGKGRKYHHQNFAESANLYSIVEESYTNFATTKAYNLEEALVKKHGATNRRQKEAQEKGLFLSGLAQPVITLVNSLTFIGVNLVGGYLTIQGLVPLGTVVTMILFARQFASPLEQIAAGVSQMQRTTAAAYRVFQFLDREEEDPKTGHVDPKAVQGNVEFKNVAFSYDPQTPLIRDLSFKAKQGQTVAIVGPTGAGKTTLVNLLMGFYDIGAGQITIDGVPLSQMNRDEARELFAMVLQETWLFRGTVAENVAYGKPDATREEIVHACDQAYCDHFIRTLPKGYDTIIGDESTTLSGGQKQLLTIARAILSDRRLLILDEATSNVDTRTEVLIQKAMNHLMEGRTCFVIAHRLSTIVHADCILVIRDGDIVEMGTHKELLAKKGFYAQLYASQYDNGASA